MVDLSGLAALAEDAATLLLGGTAPDAISLAGAEGVLEARLAHRASAADHLGYLGLVVGGGIEDVGFDTSARGELPPGLVGQGDHILTTGKATKVRVGTRTTA